MLVSVLCTGSPDVELDLLERIRCDDGLLETWAAACVVVVLVTAE